MTEHLPPNACRACRRRYVVESLARQCERREGWTEPQTPALAFRRIG